MWVHQISWGDGGCYPTACKPSSDGWKADVLASHSDGGVIDVLKAWWNVRKALKARLAIGDVDVVIFTLQHDGRGDAKLD